MRQLSSSFDGQQEGRSHGARRWARRAAITAALALASAALAAAGTVTGVVKNGTSGKPAAGVQVILIQLQGGMQPVAETKSDAQGNYKIDNPGVGQAPMLIRAVYNGVMFHQPLLPGSSTANVTVYEPTSDAKTVQLGSRLIVFQTSGDNLLVGEEYSLTNQSQPPVAYFNQKGNFNFDLPEGADLKQVSSWGPSGMPVTQSTIDRGARKFAIAYAFQPGDNGVRLSYQMPYPSNHATLRFSTAYAVQRIMLVAPPTMQVTSAGFTAAGTEQGFNLYTRDTVPAGLPFEVTLSGTAPAPAADQQSQGASPDAGAGQEQDPINGRDSGPAIQTLPNRLQSLQWILIAGFTALFALGLLLVWRKPILVVADGAPVAAAAAIPERARPVAKPSVAPHAPSAASAAEVNREVEQSLDGLKDKLFRLELRRQAGTISEEQYAQERAHAEKILRDLVQG